MVPSAETARPNAPDAAQLASAALNASAAQHIPRRLVYVPRSGPAPPPVATTGGHVEVTYPEAPAPLGIADFGLTNVSGTAVPYRLNTTSLAGTFRTNSTVGLQPEYLDSGVPDGYGIQLNAVLTNVTLQGANETDGLPNQFWTQNVVQYAAQLHELQFIDNVWAFWPGFNSSTFAAHGPNGTQVGTRFYYAIGPTIDISYPFSLTLYLNSTVIDGDNAVFFNYTLSNATRTESGSYDYVQFNSDGAAAAGSAVYEANGFNYDPVGLPNDFEFIVGGPGGGSTTDFLAADASLGLRYWNTTAGGYRAVPSAYDTGGETGETASGAGVGYVGTTAYLTTGPSIAAGLWNATGSAEGDAGLRLVHLRVSPSSAFLFVGPEAAGGNLSAPSSTWQWAPLVGPSQTDAGWLSGNLALPPGRYSVAVLESDYAPALTTLTVGAGAAWLNVTLAADASYGIYTPIFAWSNDQLPALSSAGAGSASDPYRLIDDALPGQLLNPLFGGFNDYGFPTFAGLELLGTTAHVVATPPSFRAPAPSWLLASTSLLDVPDVLGLASWVVGTQNVAVVNATFTGIWFALSLEGADASDLMVFQSEDVLVANDTFEISGGTGLFVYDQGLFGAGRTTIWGNTFGSNDSVVFFPSCSGYCEGLELPDVGLQLMTQGALVYNNAFWLLDGDAAWTPTSDWWSLLISPAVSYSDRWNVTPQPAADVAHAAAFPWFPLTGSILGTSRQGGNFWQIYGTPGDPFGELPFTNHGNITVGGDYDPLLTSALYPVTVAVAVLPNDPWIIQVSSGPGYGIVANGSQSGTVRMLLPNGSYSVTGTIFEPGTQQESPGQAIAYSGFNVTGGPTNATIRFPPDYLVLFVPYGYEWNDTAWGLCLNASFTWRTPSPWTFTGGALSAALSNGTWNFTSYVIDWNYGGISGPGCASVPEMKVTVAVPVGTITVNGGDLVIPVEFNETYPVTVTTLGVPEYDSWLITDPPYPDQGSEPPWPDVLHMINGTYHLSYASQEPSVLPYSGGHWANVTLRVDGAPTSLVLPFQGGNPVKFLARGLPSNRGYRWGVTLRATSYATYEPYLFGYVPNGTFVYTVDPVTGGYPIGGSLATYAPQQPFGIVRMFDGRPVTVVVPFVRTYNVSFVESGLPLGTSWSVDVGGRTLLSEASSTEGPFPNGSFFYVVRPVSGYSARPQVGVVRVRGDALVVLIKFVPSRRLPGAPVAPVVARAGGWVAIASWVRGARDSRPRALQLRRTLPGGSDGGGTTRCPTSGRSPVLRNARVRSPRE